MSQSVTAPSPGSQAFVICQGAQFEASEKMKSVRNLLVDFFKCGNATSLSLSGIEHVIVLTALEPTTSFGGGPEDLSRIRVHHFRLNLKNSGNSNVPLVEHEELGPRMDLILDRCQEPDNRRWRDSIKVPRIDKPKKQKNVTTDSLGEKRGRIYVDRDSMKALHTPHWHKEDNKPSKKPKKSAPEVPQFD
eukprot:GHVL01010610.1.p1 GENE.GHVL01010610.1~~GHVL01010610.1.p1  ORF type:complete len:190 (+),score=22.52 GHVL01010610.1:387-956(+)